MRKIEFSMSACFGLIKNTETTFKHTEIYEFDDDEPDEEIEECFRAWKEDCIDADWNEVDDE